MIEVKMTHRDVIEKASKLFGGTAIRTRRPANDRCQAQYTTRIRCGTAVAMMKLLLPHMGQRRAARIRELILLDEQGG
jgi:hypothetical protein